MSYISPKNRAVLITGCDSGFGHNVCYQLDSYGFHVFAGVLSTDSESAEKLRTKCSNRLKVIKLDVTLDEDVKLAVKEIELSGLDLWAVLNNAGIAQYALVEMGPGIDIFEKTFAVNVFGLVRVTKHCLPLLRRSGGRVVNMASVAGRFTFWGITAYCMSKYAVRAFSDGLRKELMSFGVKVVTIEPNMYKTEIVNLDLLNKTIESVWLQTSAQIREDYGGHTFYEQLKRRLRYNVEISRPEVHEVLDVQEKAITLCEPDLYYRCAAISEKPSLWFLSLLPESAQDFFLTGKIFLLIIRVLKMNVTDCEEVANVFNQIKCSGLELWAVVNNAGIAINAPIEWGHDIRELSHTFDVNVFGAVRVAKQSLPLLRISKGRIINVSSLAGRLTLNGLSYYSMSKHAIRSFSDGLRNEVEYFNINVITIEPVLYRTHIINWSLMKNTLDKVWDQSSEEVKSVYSDKYRRGYERRSKSLVEVSRKQIKEVTDYN
ncbi:unnamed protein product [Medioppia subpectinata]|uniref:Uncharacterized protein n=1 Tax=Medioppia subpectinata TaxID=1979941 RepID=A0A7R9L2X8_9ACAR|nr:unnamed protein product [Medioppia subpectinata]CAG2114257.1 unnamed protein product [Medioppia subpectinata]